MNGVKKKKHILTHFKFNVQYQVGYTKSAVIWQLELSLYNQQSITWHVDTVMVNCFFNFIFYEVQW